MFSFNFLGKDSYKDFGVYVEERPSMPLPERNVTLTEVPGLNEVWWRMMELIRILSYL